MREEFSADASDGTLLQRGVSATSAAVVAVEERQRYRRSTNGRQKRQQQSERYRQQAVRSGRQADGEEAARGSSQSIPVKIFFRPFV